MPRSAERATAWTATLEASPHRIYRPVPVGRSVPVVILDPHGQLQLRLHLDFRRRRRDPEEQLRQEGQTARLGDLAPGHDASSPGPFTAIGNIVITGADDGIHGREPWAIPRREI